MDAEGEGAARGALCPLRHDGQKGRGAPARADYKPALCIAGRSSPRPAARPQTRSRGGPSAEPGAGSWGARGLGEGTRPARGCRWPEEQAPRAPRQRPAATYLGDAATAAAAPPRLGRERPGARPALAPPLPEPAPPPARARPRPPASAPGPAHALRAARSLGSAAPARPARPGRPARPCPRPPGAPRPASPGPCLTRRVGAGPGATRLGGRGRRLLVLPAPGHRETEGRADRPAGWAGRVRASPRRRCGSALGAGAAGLGPHGAGAEGGEWERPASAGGRRERAASASARSGPGPGRRAQLGRAGGGGVGAGCNLTPAGGDRSSCPPGPRAARVKAQTSEALPLSPSFSGHLLPSHLQAVSPRAPPLPWTAVLSRGSGAGVTEVLVLSALTRGAGVFLWVPQDPLWWRKPPQAARRPSLQGKSGLPVASSFTAL